jgi:hypothetical protein
MKSKKQTKKMKLSKVTIARLNQNEEANVKGGAWPTYWCSGSCDRTLCYECYLASEPTACS